MVTHGSLGVKASYLLAQCFLTYKLPLSCPQLEPNSVDHMTLL